MSSYRGKKLENESLNIECLKTRFDTSFDNDNRLFSLTGFFILTGGPGTFISGAIDPK